MGVGGFAFVTIVLFMVHELDEIVFIRRYIDKHSGDERYKAEMFVAGARRYPSTELIAAMICEELIVSSLILLAGTLLGSIEVVAATFIAYALHLLAHIREAFVFPGWAPGSRTAVLTSPLVIAVLGTMMFPVSWPLLAVFTIVIGAGLLANLNLMRRLAGRVDAAITSAA